MRTRGILLTPNHSVSSYTIVTVFANQSLRFLLTKKIDRLRAINLGTSRPVHDRTDLLPSIVKPLAYGVSGSNFICVMQFLYDPRVPPVALALLIGSIPPLITIGALFGMFEMRPIPNHGPMANAKLIALFTFELSALCSVFGYGKLLSVVKFEFLVALAIGMIATLIIVSIINHVLKKGH